MTGEKVSGLESERVAGILREDIMLGRRPPGARLVERDIAAELNVSRLPVRQAIWTLVSEGIVVQKPRSWARVREFSVKDIRDFAEVREAIETLVFVLATERHDDAGIARLREIVAREKAAAAVEDADGARTAAAQFHLAALALAGNDMLDELASILVTRLRWLFGQHDNLVESATEHEQIVESMAARDVDAIRVLLPKHLEGGREAAERRLRRLAGEGS
ncbi:GntR family transcriptional regulator [Microbacterium sp.]|uniref:GntR family transcriptional regulator n=1 Tax=Microbacterium sp. TaxID=51671 RepID=UPI0028125C17|nr:GntR family transcriptional regulator [Microbacterium sp.]